MVCLVPPSPPCQHVGPVIFVCRLPANISRDKKCEIYKFLNEMLHCVQAANVDNFFLIKRLINYIGGRIVVRAGGGGGGGGARSHWPGLLSCVSVRLISWAPLQPLSQPSRRAVAVWPQSSLPPSSAPHSVSPAPSLSPDNIKSADSDQHTATTD